MGSLFSNSDLPMSTESDIFGSRWAPDSAIVFLVSFASTANSIPVVPEVHQQHYAVFVSYEPPSYSDKNLSRLSEMHGSLLHLGARPEDRYTYTLAEEYWRPTSERVLWCHQVGTIENLHHTEFLADWHRGLRRHLQEEYLRMASTEVSPSGKTLAEQKIEWAAEKAAILGFSDQSHGFVWDSFLNCQSFAKRIIESFGLTFPPDVKTAQDFPVIMDWALYLQEWSKQKLR